jgi:hypothetical protein
MMLMMKYFSFLFFMVSSLTLNAQVSGCTDPLSTNYNPAATINDGSCTYASASIAPSASVALPATVNETSGLIQWNGNIYTHNDNANTNLYALSTSGSIVQSLNIPGVTNQDWEEISQDADYIYLGDFGNNSNGNRANLKIYKVSKASLLEGNPEAGIINFTYSNQSSFTATGSNNTDFDCEAFVVSGENIYLFTKQWVTKKTSVYSLSKTPGTHIANLETTFNVNGLITGATYLEDKELVVLSGYSTSVQPFLYLLYDFEGTAFFSGNKRKINVSLGFNQTEGITTLNGLDYYVTNEHLSQSFLNIPQKLHRFDLRPYLSNYIPEPVISVWNGNEWTNGLPEPALFDAVIEGDYDSALNGEINAASLTINAGVVTIASGTDFNITGKVTIDEDATFTIENNANLIQTDDVANEGIAFAEKKSNPLQHLDYTLWSSPVSGQQTLKEFSPQTLDKRFYVFNTAEDSYDNYESPSGIFGGNPSEVTFVPAKSYLIRMPVGLPASQTHIFESAFEGTPNNGTITIPLATDGGRINAVGNPYPSPINIHAFIDANQANLESGTLYFWRKTNNPDATSYATVNKLAYVANAAAGGDTGSGTFVGLPTQWVINPGQGFFLEASANAGDLTFTNNMRRSDNNGQFFRMDNESTDVLSRLWLNIENAEGAFAQMAVGYTTMATSGIDFGLDAKLNVREEQIALFSRTGETNLAIQARPEFTSEDVVAVGYNAVTAGEYTISLPNSDGLFANGQPVFLKDNLLAITHDFSNGAYTFTTEAGTASNRFEIIYASGSLGLEAQVANVDVVVYKKSGTVHVDGGTNIINEVIAYDISGRKIYSKQDINQQQAALAGLKALDQVIALQIVMADGSTVNKKIIN